MGGVDRLQKGRFIAIEGHGGSKRNGHCRVPYDKRAMAKHDTIMPTFYPWSALKCTGAGFMKWTSRGRASRPGRERNRQHLAEGGRHVAAWWCGIENLPSGVSGHQTTFSAARTRAGL